MTTNGSEHSKLPVVFQSTPSLRKVTHPLEPLEVTVLISIHTFLAEGDYYLFAIFLVMMAFQSTPSLRKVTLNRHRMFGICPISIHTFLAEGDFYVLASSHFFRISIHTFLAEGDQNTKILKL